MFDSIRPYTDTEASSALKRVAEDSHIAAIASFLGCDEKALRNKLLSIESVTRFQNEVMLAAVDGIIKKTTGGVTISGTENLKASQGRFHVIMSNHRDIVLDPSLLQYALHASGYDYSEVAAGNNLISMPLIADLMRSNRMVTVKRNGSVKELYQASVELSAYIRSRVCASEGGSSVWIAQRQGRAKDGCDLTEQGLLKMLDMSGRGSFEQNFGELSIIPLSISYEYEPCGVRKARELLIKERDGKYVKSSFEDTESIICGITQQKGRVHLHFCEEISASELAGCASLEKNDRYRCLAGIIDSRILEGYRLWPTAHWAKAMLSGEVPNADFASYIDEEVSSAAGDGIPEKDLRNKLLSIFAAPLRNL